MSAEPERTDRRNRLGSDIIEALECLRSWLNIIDSEAELVMGLKEDITKETASEGGKIGCFIRGISVICTYPIFRSYWE